MRPLALLVLLFAAGSLSAAPPAEKITPEDEKLLKAAKIDTEGPALIDYFHKRTTTPKEREQIDALIRLLGDDSFKVREKASEDLLARGTLALPQLRHALNDPDEEIRERAREGIAAVESKTNPALSVAVVHALRVRAPAESVKTLLEYLPDAENDAVTEELLMALTVLGVKENKVDTLLVEALKDKNPICRSAAALVVGRFGTAEQRRGVHALLTDTDMRVRFRAAQGLLAARERLAIPALIALLSEAQPELAARAEELLACVASARAIHQPITENAALNRQIRNAWEQWWKQNGKMDLSRADVDLPPFNPALRARETARQFLTAAMANDQDKMDKLVELPFYAVGTRVINKRDQVDQFIGNALQMMVVRGGGAAVPTVQGTSTMDEYLKTAAQSEHAMLQRMSRNDVRVVILQVPQVLIRGGLDIGGDCVLFVRTSGEQPQVFGISFGGGRIIFPR